MLIVSFCKRTKSGNPGRSFAAGFNSEGRSSKGAIGGKVNDRYRKPNRQK